MNENSEITSLLRGNYRVRNFS